MGFGPMDGFFLAVFLAVCILVAVVLRCLCYRCCLQSCSDKFRHPNEDDILPRHSTPSITPACRPHRNHHQQQQQQLDHSPQIANRPRGIPQIPPTGTVFTIYTFPQQQSPELLRPRSTGPPKYSNIPADSPPKYEDLFPITSKPTTPATDIEMQMTPESLSEVQPPSRDLSFVQAHTSTSVNSTRQSITTAVPETTACSQNSMPPSVPTEAPTEVPNRVPKEDPPLYDTIYPHKSGE